MAIASLYMTLALRIVNRALEGKQIQNPAKEMGIACYNSVVSITSGGVANLPEKTSAGEKVIIAGFSVFAFIFMSAYTASFTLSLIEGQKEDPLNSLREIVVNRNKRVCILDAIRLRILKRYSFVTDAHILGFPDQALLLKAFGRGDCIALIAEPFEVKRWASMDEEFCRTKTIVGNPLLEIPLGAPISQKFAEALNFLIIKSEERSLFPQLLEEWERELSRPPACDEETSDSSVDGDSSLEGSKLSISNMAFPVLTTLFCTTVGLAWFLWSNYARKHIMKKGRERVKLVHSLLLPTQQNSRSPHEWTKEDEERMRTELGAMSSGELVLLLRKDRRVPQSLLNDAMDSLPNKQALESLLYTLWHSDQTYKERVHHLENQPLLSLYSTALDSLKLEDGANAALNCEDPKLALIHLIMKHSTNVTINHPERAKRTEGELDDDAASSYCFSDTSNNMAFEKQLRQSMINEPKAASFLDDFFLVLESSKENKKEPTNAIGEAPSKHLHDVVVHC